MPDKFTPYRDQMRDVNAMVKRHFPRLKPNDAFVYYSNIFHKYCFRLVKSDFSWLGDADNGYDARNKGWKAFLKEKGINF